jgi:hypothetical protein
MPLPGGWGQGVGRSSAEQFWTGQEQEGAVGLPELAPCLCPLLSKHPRYPFCPLCRDSTIPYWLAILTSLAALLASVLAAELWLARRMHADATDAAAAVLHFVVDGISAFLVTGLATEVRSCEAG